MNSQSDCVSDPPLAFIHSTTTVPLKRSGSIGRRTKIRVVKLHG